MKSALLSIPLFFAFLLLTHSSGGAISQTSPFTSIQQQEKEVKEFSQRLNKLINAYNRKKIESVRVLYEGIKADIRRELAQIKARTVQLSKIRPDNPNFTSRTNDMDQLRTRMLRMQAIKDYIGQRWFPTSNDNKDQGKELISLLREFETLMKEELHYNKKGR